METRTIKQVKVFKLILNDMRFYKIETVTLVAVSTDYNKLKEWVENQRSKFEYDDKNSEGYIWRKNFIKGSELEWFNPPGTLDLLSTHQLSLTPFGTGIVYEWVDEDLFNEIINKPNNPFILVD